MSRSSTPNHIVDGLSHAPAEEKFAVSAEEFPLSAVPIGNECVLSPLGTELVAPDIKRRLAELGLRPGVCLSVTQKTSGGGRVIRIHNTRYAMDNRTASAIKVQPVPAAESKEK